MFFIIFGIFYFLFCIKYLQVVFIASDSKIRLFIKYIFSMLFFDVLCVLILASIVTMLHFYFYPSIQMDNMHDASIVYPYYHLDKIDTVIVGGVLMSDLDLFMDVANFTGCISGT